MTRLEALFEQEDIQQRAVAQSARKEHVRIVQMHACGAGQALGRTGMPCQPSSSPSPQATPGNLQRSSSRWGYLPLRTLTF